MSISVGTGGTVAFSGVTYHVKKWEFNDTVAQTDITDTELAFYKGIPCIRKGTGKFEADYDAAVGMPTGINSNTVGAFTFTMGTGGRTLTGTAKILSRPVVMDARGVVSWTCDFVTYSTYTAT